MEIALLLLSTISFVYLIYYYFYSFRVLSTKKSRFSDPIVPMSVIVCYSGHSPVFQKYFPHILAQKFPKFELIVVYETISELDITFLNEQIKQHDFLKLINITNSEHSFLNKKKALHVGISHATYDHIVTIDADCYPENDSWLENISQAFGPGIDIVLGVSPYVKFSNWSNKWIRFDTIQVAFQYISMALQGKAYMGVGRNMAFKKELWNDAYLTKYGSFGMGDDDTLVQFFRTSDNIAIVLFPKVFSYPKTSYWCWFKQKIRHVSTGKLYSNKQLFQLGLVPFLTCIFYSSLFIWLSYFKTHYSIIVLLSLYWMFKMAIVYLFERKIKLKNKTWYYVPIFDFIYCFHLLFFPFLSLIYNPKKWL